METGTGLDYTRINGSSGEQALRGLIWNIVVALSGNCDRLFC